MLSPHPSCRDDRGGDIPRFRRSDEKSSKWGVSLWRTTVAKSRQIGECPHGRRLGAIVFQCAPQGLACTRDSAAFAGRLAEFCTALPAGTLSRWEVRDASLLSTVHVSTLQTARVGHCVSVHPRLPDLSTQLEIANGVGVDSLVIRWNLHAGFRYCEARERYRPFDRLVDPDPSTRATLASAASGYLKSGRAVYITVNNKAEGSAPRSVFALAEAIAAE